MRAVKIGAVVEPIRTWDPTRSSEGQFRYIDLGAVDQDLKDVNGDRVLPCAEAPSRARQLVSTGDVLVSTVRPNLNGVAHVAPRLDGATASTGFCVLRPSASLDSRYLFHWVRSPWFVADMVRKATGQSYPAVSDRIVKESEIPLPDLAEQQRIAAVLDRADELRTMRRDALAGLDNLVRAVFLELFGDPAGNPLGWPRHRLSDVIVDGPQNGLYKPASAYGSGCPIVRIDAFYDGVITGLANLRRLEVSAAEISRYGLQEGDILINRVNSLEYLGKSAIVPELFEPTVFESNMMRFRVTRDAVDPVFLIQLLQSRHVKAQIRAAAKDAVNQSSINQGDVRNLSIYLPPLRLQERFAAAVRSIGRLTVTKRQHLATLDDLFASLRDRAFQGRAFRGGSRDGQLRIPRG